MKKSGRIWVIAALFAALVLILYPILYRQIIREYTSDYVAEQGYPAESIQHIEIQHSYLAKVLGYNEWRISVEFKKEPDMFFWFTCKKGKIIYNGVSSDPMMDKEDVVKYSDLFKKGMLLD